MAADNVTSIERVEDDLERGYADLAAMQRSGADVALASGQAMIRGSQAFATETLAFAQSRLKSALEAASALHSCGSPDAALAIQVQYVQAATKAYVDEFRVLSELSSRVIGETLEPLRDATGTVAKARTNAAA